MTSQNNDTGGSAWMSFIDPDHDDYPYASGCCEAQTITETTDIPSSTSVPPHRRLEQPLPSPHRSLRQAQPQFQHLQRPLHDHDDRHHRHRKGSNQPIPGRPGLRTFFPRSTTFSNMRSRSPQAIIPAVTTNSTEFACRCQTTRGIARFGTARRCVRITRGRYLRSSGTQ